MATWEAFGEGGQGVRRAQRATRSEGLGDQGGVWRESAEGKGAGVQVCGCVTGMGRVGGSELAAPPRPECPSAHPGRPAPPLGLGLGRPGVCPPTLGELRLRCPARSPNLLQGWGRKGCGPFWLVMHANPVDKKTK